MVQKLSLSPDICQESGTIGIKKDLRYYRKSLIIKWLPGLGSNQRPSD